MAHLFLGRKGKSLKSCSEEDLRQQILKRGENLYKEFDAASPQAFGIEEKDKVRLKMFKTYIGELDKESRESLEAWLCCRLDDAINNFSELTSATIEEWESKSKRIYAEHLQVFNPNKLIMTVRPLNLRKPFGNPRDLKKLLKV